MKTSKRNVTDNVRKYTSARGEASTLHEQIKNLQQGLKIAQQHLKSQEHELSLTKDQSVEKYREIADAARAEIDSLCIELDKSESIIKELPALSMGDVACDTPALARHRDSGTPPVAYSSVSNVSKLAVIQAPNFTGATPSYPDISLSSALAKIGRATPTGVDVHQPLQLAHKTSTQSLDRIYRTPQHIL